MNTPAMQDLRVSLVQGETRWHEPAGNRAYYGGLTGPLKGITDLVVLPETFTSGFSNDAIDSAETMDGPTVAWMRERASVLDAAICGSVQLRVGGRVYNRLLFATPDGRVQTYDKRHLFTYAKEHERYAAGNERLIVEWRGWRICPLICYDLRFPVFMRNGLDASGRADYDLSVFVANWPSARAYAWNALLRARAIENVCCVAAVNRAGVDGNGLQYQGDSLLLDAKGAPLLHLTAGEHVQTATLRAADLIEWRTRFPALSDADAFSLA